MANQILEDKFIFLSAITEKEQVILKVLDNNRDIAISEGMSIELNNTVCNRIDFACNSPLIVEDISKDSSLNDLHSSLSKANINFYLGVPITLKNGEVFGTLCAVNSVASEFDSTSVKMFQKIARLFSYYLEELCEWGVKNQNH